MRLAFVALIAAACSPRPRADGPLGPAAAVDLAESQCRRPEGMSFITCQLHRGDTVVSGILDTNRAVRSLTRSWRGYNGSTDFQRTRDSLERLMGPGIPCETDVDVSFQAGRAWIRPPMVIELRLGGELGTDRIELTRRIAENPQCSGSSVAPPA